ncbi:hypothetical protein [Virgibacillus senegalensis]|uniref:hypothetical protein n=1 Tax=Virgibacillus senegalensis TaxID=1499679 RepID=UPI00069F9164|nr:hypothetical protein [Virgibacillus senegalensis]
MQVDQELLFDIATEASSILTRKIIQATDERTLRITLNEYNLIDLLPEQENSFTYPNGNILIFGESNVKEHVIYQIFKKQGIDKDRVKLHLGFNEYKKFNFKRLSHRPENRLILFGPIPHSTRDKGNYSSVINMMENEDGFPKVVRLTANQSLKITRNSLTEVIEEEVKTGFLKVD